jgi:protein-tyrosine phosphatase
MGQNQSNQVCGHRGLLEAASLATTLPEATLGELLDSTDRRAYPAYAGSEILPGLFQGGTEDDDVVHVAAQEHRFASDSAYDVVVTLYASAQPAPWGVEELRYGFMDSALEGPDIARVIRAARYAYQRWTDGDTVLIRCQAGMNRSGLVTALVLVMAGLSPAQAIALIRERRSSGALFNDHFVRWLLEDGESAAATARQISPSVQRAA